MSTRSRPASYSIRFSDDARAHLLELRARDRRTVLDRIRATLQDQPTVETANLKMLRPNPIASYELRIGAFRVFFEAEPAQREVLVLAVGRKDGSRLRLGGKVVVL